MFEFDIPWDLDLNFSSILYSDLLITGFYFASLALVITALIVAISIFSNRPSWGQVRSMGGPFVAFIWIQIVFYLALIEGALGIIDFFIRIPFWIDLIILFAIIALVLAIFFRLSKRETFKRHLFAVLVILPLGLGLPSAHFVAQLMEQGTIELGQRGIIKTLRYGNVLDSVNIRNADSLLEALPIARGLPRSVGTVAGTVQFLDTFEIGKLGDYLTARRLGGMGYKKLLSKYDSIHGIDGIFYKSSADGKIGELIIVENKVGNGRLVPGQMSDNWVGERLDKMLATSDESLRRTATMVIDLIDNSPNKVSKQLWHHDLVTGKTVVRDVSSEGKAGDTIYEWIDSFIEKEVKTRCSRGTLVCEP